MQRRGEMGNLGEKRIWGAGVGSKHGVLVIFHGIRLRGYVGLGLR